MCLACFLAKQHIVLNWTDAFLLFMFTR